MSEVLQGGGELSHVEQSFITELELEPVLVGFMGAYTILSQAGCIHKHRAGEIIPQWLPLHRTRTGFPATM